MAILSKRLAFLPNFHLAAAKAAQELADMNETYRSIHLKYIQHR